MHRLDIDSNATDEFDDNERIRMPIAYKKRVRVKFDQEQLDALECTFEQHHYPTVDVVDDLAERLDLPTQKITVWFQNRRARLKKNATKSDDRTSVEQENQTQYDSGIHLDEEVSHECSSSPEIYPMLHLPPPPTAPITSTSSYHMPNAYHAFYSNLWHNACYSLPAASFPPNITGSTPGFSHDSFQYGYAPEVPPYFVFQDTSNYQPLNEFNGEL